MQPSDLSFFHHPRSVAVVGASDDPDKIGGRPIRYLRELGFAGEVYPVNPKRSTVQGLVAFPDLDGLPGTPEVVLVAVPGPAAAETVERCAALGVKGCIIFSSGFGEVDDPAGRELQARMLEAANGAGMRLVGPNSQGLANFASGAVLGFSTMFIEEPPADGPVGIVSQSGAMCSVPYGLLRRQGVGVRYAHASGNDADVSVGELAETILADPDIRLLLIYLEDIRDPSALERTATLARAHDVPVVVLMGGRSADGQRAAQSHTGALANEHRVVDAFLERTGIWRARSVAELVGATELYLQPWRPKGRRLTIVSNSGAACVLAADAATEYGIPLSQLAPRTRHELEAVLPRFASKTNPVDVTAALLSDSSLVGKVLGPMAQDPETDACLFAVPVSGRGYDVKQFAADAAGFADQSGKPLIVSTPQPSVAAEFRRAGVVVFEEEYAAVGALAQYLGHRARMADAGRRRPAVRRAPVPARTLNEADSLDRLDRLGLPVVPHVLCGDPAAAREAFDSLGGVPVAVKGCTSTITHKSEHGLVSLGLTSPEEVEAAAETILRRLTDAGVEADGVVVASMIGGMREALLGAHLDPVFGPVVVVGAGGKYVEAVPDVRLLLPPFDLDEVLEAIASLNWAPVLRGVRGEPPTDVGAWAKAAVDLGDAMVAEGSGIQSVDANPLMVAAVGTGAPGAVIVDAVVVEAAS